MKASVAIAADLVDLGAASFFLASDLELAAALPFASFAETAGASGARKEEARGLRANGQIMTGILSNLLRRPTARAGNPGIAAKIGPGPQCAIALFHSSPGPGIVRPHQRRGFMNSSLSRLRAVFAAIVVGLRSRSPAADTIRSRRRKKRQGQMGGGAEPVPAPRRPIPNLVATVQGYAKQGKGRPDLGDRGQIKGHHRSRSTLHSIRRRSSRFRDAQNQLSGALGRLIAVSEAYPDLKSNANFLALQSQLEARKTGFRWRAATMCRPCDYNLTLRTFPS